MNTPYNVYNAKEAADILKVDYSTVSGWCRRGIINCENVGDGPYKNRYSIEEDEVRYIKNLIQKHGVRKMLLHYNKNWKEDAKAYKPEPVKVQRTFDVYDEEEDEDGVAPAYYPPSHKSKKETGFDYSMLNTTDVLQRALPGVTPPEAQLTPAPAEPVNNVISEFDPDEVLDLIIEVRDIKNRLFNIEQEKTKLTDRLAECKKQILEAI